ARDAGPAQAADQLLALAREHGAADDFDPAQLSGDNIHRNSQHTVCRGSSGVCCDVGGPGMRAATVLVGAYVGRGALRYLAPPRLERKLQPQLYLAAASRPDDRIAGRDVGGRASAAERAAARGVAAPPGAIH